MDKKISISMENDQVSFIEVDGIQYSTADEIPDLEDRAKVTELVTKMTDESAGDGFDPEFAANFEKEFQEMRKKTAIFPMLFAAIFLGIAVILLGIAIFSAIQSARAAAKERETSGQVVDQVERQMYDTENKRYQVYSHPVVTFLMNYEQPQRVELQEGYWPPAYRVGDTVTVLYDPAHPEDAHIKSFLGAISRWLLPAITGGMGLIFMTIALSVIRAQRKPVHFQ